MDHQTFTPSLCNSVTDHNIGVSNSGYPIHCVLDLYKVYPTIKMDMYVVISFSDGDDGSKQESRMPVDHSGKANPTWNFLMTFKMEEAALQMNPHP